MARHNKGFCVFVAALWWLSWSQPARAYEEQVSLDVGVGATLLAQPDSSPRGGPLLEVGAGLGVGEAIVLRANLGWAALFRDPQHGAREEPTGRLRLEAIYQLDVLQFVPFFGVGATVMTAVHSAAAAPIRAGGQLVLGADYLLSRRWICGLDLRTALLSEGHQLLNATDVSFRLSRMFEAF